jgi:hypothetical protein
VFRRDDRRRHAGGGADLGDPLELKLRVVRGLEAVLGVLGEAGLDDPVERRRRHRLERRDRRGLLLHDRGDQGCLARSGKRLPPRRHLVQNGAEREYVSSDIGLPAFELLRRHVLKRPQDRPLLCERTARHGRKGRESFSPAPSPAGEQDLRQAEVEELHSGLRQHHVAGLQVPVHDPLPVRLVQRVGDLDPEAQRLLRRERAFQEPVRQRFSFQVLHDEVLDAVLIPDVVERADVRMRERRDRLRFPLEPLPHLLARGEV